MSKRPLSPVFDRVARIPVVLLLLLVSNAARAEDDAKAHYQKATAHFAVGEYHDAAIEYEEAFKLKQDPAILFNAAQSFRLAGENQKALLLYNNIVKLYPGTHYAKDSKERIQKLAESGTSPPAATPSQEASSAPPAVAPPVTPIAPVPAAPAPAVVAPAEPTASAPTAVISSSPPAENHPIYTRWWFWTGVGVVVVGAVVAGVALSSGGSAGPWNNLPPVTGVR